MKKIYVSLIVLFVFSSSAFANTNIKLNDIENHWAVNEINLLLNESVINGYSDNTFKPDNNITVSEFLKILIEFADYKLETIGNRWPDWYIQTAIKNKLIFENEFDSYSRYITRGEVVKIIEKYINLDDISKSKNIFTDLSEHEKNTVLKLVKLGVINGYSDNTFRSSNAITRAEACKVIINAYNAKQEILKTRKCDATVDITNIKTTNADIPNTYEIKNNRIYIYDTGKYANLSEQTLNQEYIKDKTIINILEELIGENSYTELKFVPDKYIINNLNICYGNKKTEVILGGYAFEIRFYENAYYNVAKSKNNPDFMNDAIIRIKINKMWDKHYELETDSSCNEKYLYKLQEVVGEILDNNVKNEFIKYIVEKRIEAAKIENSDEPKISEVKKIGKYTLNTFCINNNEIEIFIQRY